MLPSLLSTPSDPEKITTLIQSIDMTAEVKSLLHALHEPKAGASTAAYQSGILNAVNRQTHTLVLHTTEFANISIRAPGALRATQLYSVPGCSILFALHNQAFRIQTYDLAEDTLTFKGCITVTEGKPVMIDGRHTLFDYNALNHHADLFIGIINFPDPSADIRAFDRESLRKIAWFPHDDSAAHFLLSLELLEATGDPEAGKVAQELTDHTHPAVAWRAFQMTYQRDPLAALSFVPLLRQLKNARLDHLLDLYREAACT